MHIQCIHAFIDHIEALRLRTGALLVRLNAAALQGVDAVPVTVEVRVGLGASTS